MSEQYDPVENIKRYREYLTSKYGPADKSVEQLARASILDEAKQLITGDRNNTYGPPTQDFQRTAEVLNALGYARILANDQIVDIVQSDIAIIVAAVKLSRLMHSRGKRDNWVDLAGYAACGYECTTVEANELSGSKESSTSEGSTSKESSTFQSNIASAYIKAEQELSCDCGCNDHY